jgi:hypothetical protein
MTMPAFLVAEQSHVDLKGRGFQTRQRELMLGQRSPEAGNGAARNPGIVCVAFQVHNLSRRATQFPSGFPDENYMEIFWAAFLI